MLWEYEWKTLLACKRYILYIILYVLHILKVKGANSAKFKVLVGKGSKGGGSSKEILVPAPTHSWSPPSWPILHLLLHHLHLTILTLMLVPPVGGTVLNNRNLCSFIFLLILVWMLWSISTKQLCLILKSFCNHFQA